MALDQLSHLTLILIGMGLCVGSWIIFGRSNEINVSGGGTGGRRRPTIGDFKGDFRSSGNRHGNSNATHVICPNCKTQLPVNIDSERKISIQCAECDHCFHVLIRWKGAHEYFHASADDQSNNDPVARAFKTLRIPAGSTLEQIKLARDRLAKKFHSDKFEQFDIDQDHQEFLSNKMAEINAAYELLSRKIKK